MKVTVDGVVLVTPYTTYHDVHFAVVEQLGADLAYYGDRAGSPKVAAPVSRLYYSDSPRFHYFGSIQSLRWNSAAWKIAPQGVFFVCDSPTIAEDFDLAVFPYAVLDPALLLRLSTPSGTTTTIRDKPTPRETLLSWIQTLGERSFFQKLYPLFFKVPNKDVRKETQAKISEFFLSKSVRASLTVARSLPEPIRDLLLTDDAQSLRMAVLDALSTNVDAAMARHPSVAEQDLRYIVKKALKEASRV